MMKYVLAALISVGMLTAACAQQPSPTVPEKEYTLIMSATDVNLIGEALGKLPYGQVAPLFNKLQVQITKQNEPEKKVETEAKK